MNTAARDRALLPVVKDVLVGRTPISKLKMSKEKDGSVKVALHTSRPTKLQIETSELTQALKEAIGGNRNVTIEIIKEARAVAKFVRTTPRKARLVIDAIKGKRVSDAVATLRFVPNHAAELISKVIVSAAANAMDGWGASPDELKIANILADGGPSMKRVHPRAQGRAYRILKRTSHLTVILVDAPPLVAKPRRVALPSKAKTVPASATVPKAAPAQTAAPATEIAMGTAPEETLIVTTGASDADVQQNVTTLAAGSGETASEGE